MAALVATSSAALSLAMVRADAAPPTPQDPNAQAVQLEAQINANAEKGAALDEQLKGAQAAVDQADATIADANARIAVAKAETQQLLGRVRQRAAAIYQSSTGGSGNLGLLSNLDVSTYMTSQHYSAAASAQDNSLVDQLKSAKTQLNARQHDAHVAKQTAQAQQAALQAVQAQFAATNASLQKLLDQVKAQGALMQQLVAQAAAKRNAAIAAAAPAIAQIAPRAPSAASAASAPTGPTFDPSKIPPSSGKAGIAVAYAQAQVGKPYCYAGTGPGCYDCSGLTMMAWAQAGVQLSHPAGSQYGEIPHIPLSALQPGDLVFYGDMSHVAIYVGGGQMVEATHTGSFIFQRPMRGDFTLAGRPG